MSNRMTFAGSATGPWRVVSMTAIAGASLPLVSHIDIQRGDAAIADAEWVLRGLISNVRYATRHEVTALKAVQEPLGRPDAQCAALIPIKKSAAWWDLAQDERRAIFEETSHHNAIGMDYLPAVARQLYHCRDLGEPFDFLTLFEYPASHAAAFSELVDRLRATREWTYVEREIDIRLERV